MSLSNQPETNTLLSAHSKTTRLAVSHPKLYVPLIALVIMLALPLLLGNTKYMNILCLILLFGAASTAWNILGGYARQVSLGHGIFFGIGAYTTTLLQIHWNITPWIGMFLGGIFAVMIGLIIGLGAFRLRGHYFAISTIAFSMFIMLVFVKFYEVTGGAQGLSVPYNTSFAMMQFKGKIPYYYIFLLLLLILIFVVRKIEKSRLGYYMVAIGQDEQAAKAIGINIPRVKHTALAISAFFTAIAGTMYAQYMFFISPIEIFSIPMAIEFALISIVGGIGTLFGPILGAFVMRPVVEIINEQFGSILPGLNYFIYGLILILIILLRPNGLIGMVTQWYYYLLSKLPGYTKG
jgi:branched-chain amino acid transport system permease protein